MERVKRGAYRAKLVVRRWRPQGDGTRRPLGPPALEETLVQGAGALMLDALFEEDFLPCRSGYRPQRRAQDALRELRDAW